MTERIVEAEGLVKRYGKLTAPTARPGGRARARAGGAGPQRCRQDNVRPDDRDAAPAGRGHAPGGGARRAARAAGGPTDDRPGRTVRRGRAGAQRPGEPRDGGASVRPGPAGGAGRQHRGPPAAWPGRGRRPAGPNVLGRHAAQARPGREPGGFARLLLLDEPTTGLDPRSRVELWDAIRSMVERGTDVLLTTQYLDEADHLAGRVIIDHGRAVATGTPNELKRRVGRNVVEVHVRDRQELLTVANALARIGEGEPEIDEATRHRRSVGAGTDEPRDVLGALDAVGVTPDDVALRPPTLDEVFLALTGRATDVSTDQEGLREREGGHHVRHHRGGPRQTGLWTSTLAIARRGILKFLARRSWSCSGRSRARCSC